MKYDLRNEERAQYINDRQFEKAFRSRAKIIWFLGFVSLGILISELFK